jgi:hypothetical protein
MPTGLSGLSVVAPAALWALLALVIPVLIHLFSRSRGRLVRIGHIDLVRQARKIRVTEVKLTQWLLLLLRLFILVLATLILAGLATTGPKSSDTPAFYVTPAWLQASSEAQIDTLLSDAAEAPGAHVYLLQPGFPLADQARLIEGRQRPLGVNDDAISVWALLAERLSLEQHRDVVKVYTTDDFSQYGTHKPVLPRDVEWRVKQSRNALEAVQEAIRVLIVHDTDRAADAAIISSVLATLKEHRLPGLLWDSTTAIQPGEIPLAADWLIYLGANEPGVKDIELFDSPGVILTDANGVEGEDSTQFVSLPFYPFTTFRLDRFGQQPSSESGEPGISKGIVLLASSDGHPVLQEFHHGPTRLIRFNSRFNPAWNSLTQQVEFPELFLQLMTGSARDAIRFADAGIAAANLPGKPGGMVSDIPLPRRSLQSLLAMLLVIVWVSERWLSERISREKR